MEGIGGWLLVYLAGSAAGALFCAAGVAGRFFDYDRRVIAGVFVVLATPLALLTLQLASAPALNIAALWVGAGSISGIVIAGMRSAEDARLEEVRPTAVAIVCVAIGWAAAWTAYFLTSERVAMTFA